MRFIFGLAAACAACAQTAGVFEGAPAVVLSNGVIELTVLTDGGALANLTLHADPGKLSPLWNPSRIAREAGRPPRFGNSRGHFVCVDGFGPVSKEERAAGLTGHGEAHTLPWETRASSALSLTQSVKLPIVQEVLTRTIRLVEGENVVYVHSELDNLLAFDRPINWAEHATIGSPFLEAGVTVVDQSAGPSKTRPHERGDGRLPHRLASAQDFEWPLAPLLAGGKVDLRAAPSPPNSGDHTTTAFDPSRRLVFVTALHPARRLLLGYVIRREEYPWLQTWENYVAPNQMARGLEFGTQPFDLPRRDVITTGALFGVPTYRWLPAKSKIETSFLMFYARTPEGFRKVDDVKLEGGQLVIEDRAAGKRLALAASLGL